MFSLSSLHSASADDPPRPHSGLLSLSRGWPRYATYGGPRNDQAHCTVVNTRLMKPWAGIKSPGATDLQQPNPKLEPTLIPTTIWDLPFRLVPPGFPAISLVLALTASAGPMAFTTPPIQPSFAASGGPDLFFAAVSAQSDGRYRFLSCGRNYAFLLSPAQVKLSLLKSQPTKVASFRARSDLLAPRPVETASIRMSFLNANPQASIHGDAQMTGKVNYLIGSDPARWRTGITTYAKVRIDDLYPGIGLVYYGNHQKLEYDLTVAPGADPAAVAIRFEGVDKVFLSETGELVLKVSDGEIRQRGPLLYQVDASNRIEVSGGYRITDDGTVTFTVGRYDRRRPLIIDPLVAYSTYFGGNGADLGLAVKVDARGDFYLTGETLSTQFPFVLPTDAAQPNFGGGYYNGDAFVAKFDNTGTNLIYYTYLGGSGEDGGLDLAVDSLGHAYVAGFTLSADFPTKNALYPQISGTATLDIYPSDGFVSELNSNGSGFVYSTYLGGTNSDIADGIAVDKAGNAYVTGMTDSGDFPTLDPLEGQNTFLGGTFDAFVTKIAPNGASLVYSTYLGGLGTDEGQGIAADTNGFAYVTGLTISTNFPITANAFQTRLNNSANTTTSDAFVSKFSPSGALVYSTFLGGSANDFGYRITTDGSGNVYVTGPSISAAFPNTITDVPWLSRSGSPANAFVVGDSNSTDFPTTNVFAPLRANNSGVNDAFVLVLNSNATAVLYSGYLGGSASDSGYGVAVDAESSAYLVGTTSSSDFPTTAAPFQSSLDGSSDTFLVKIRLTDPVLSAALTGDNLQLTWPATARDFILEFAPTLASPVNWTPVTQTPVLSGAVYTTTVLATNTSNFFRLRRL